MNIDYKAVLAAGGVLLLVYWTLKRDAVAAVKTTAEAVNPVNPNNVIYSGVNDVGAALTGDTHFDLGSFLYDLSHPGGSAP